MRTDGRAELADGWKKSDDEIKTFFGFSSIIPTFMDMNWSKIKPSGIVHIFALLHAAVTILCREAGIGDELFLTVLTMTMILLVCLKKNLNLELTAGIIIVINVTGYLLGTAGADLIGLLFSSELAVHAISTAFTTELLGWSPSSSGIYSSGCTWFPTLPGRHTFRGLSQSYAPSSFSDWPSSLSAT